MDNIVFNKCQTPIDELSYKSGDKTIMFKDCPAEVQEQFWDFLNNVPFIRWLVSPDRPMISELPRDEYGRAIIDITKPPILDNSDYFRQAAITWQNNKHKYTNLKPNANPNSEFGKYIREERRRGWEGYINPDTGMWVTGDHYWLMNYCPIHMVVKRDDGLEMRSTRHSKFWDGQFLMAHYVLAARLHKHHAAYLASRGKGKTSFGAATLAKRFIIGESAENRESVQCMVTAADRTKLIGTNQILDVFIDNIDFCAKHTQFASRRLKSSKQELEWEMGYKKSGSDVAYGSQNSVSGIISGVNQDKLNGSRGVLYLVEEAGIFKDLLSMYNMIRPSVEQGSSVFGEVLMYGCVCAGTKVWTNDGRYINIENLHKEDGIIGYENDLPVKNTIGTLLEPRIKPCVKITWEDGGYLECSIDHPILKQVIHTPRINGGEQRKRTPEEVWVRADELKKGDRIIEARYIGAFGTDTLEDARLIGMLIGDGSYGYNNTPKFSSEDEELLNYIKERYDWGISKEHITKGGRHYQDIRVKGICPLLRKIGIFAQTKTAKRLPSKYQTLTEEDTKLLLAGLYDTDGCITGIGNSASIELTQANREILEQTAILLRKFGITSSITKNKPSIKEGRKDKNPWYILTVGGRTNIELFYETIPLLQHRKVEKLLKVHQWFVEHPLIKVRCYDEKKILPRTVRSIEYIGEQIIYNLSAEQSHTYLANNIVTHNTAGDDMSDFTAFQEIFYSPEGYNMEALDNVFDKEGQGRKKCCMFYPAYLNYDDSCVDENGNSDVTKALLMLLMDRYKVKYGSTDINTITKRISQYPITPQEAIIRSRGNMFPVTDLNARLNELDNNPDEYNDVYVGELVQREGKIEFVPTGEVPIRDFPTKDNKVKGAIEIFSMPQKTPDGTIPRGRYLAGCLKEGEMVNTEEGLKPVEQVTLTDKLINIDGNAVDIINLQRYYNENPVYNVKLYSIYNSTVFSEEHPIYCATPKINYHHASVAKRDGVPYRYLTYDFQFRKVKDLKVGDVVKSPNIYRKVRPFMHYWKDNARVDRRIENPLDKQEFWWLMGLIIGDGWATKDGYKIGITFNSKETQYIEMAKYIVEEILHRPFTLIKDRGSCAEYEFCCQTLNTFIKNNIGCGAGNKYLAEWIKYIPEHLKRELILGYLASDGCVTNNQIEYVSISLKLLNDMQDILFSLGIISGVSRMKHYKQKTIVNSKNVQTKDKYHLRIDRTHTKVMKTWNPDDLKLSRCIIEDLAVSHNFKRVWMSDDMNYIYFKVAGITTEEYIGTIYNFECDSHTFMCNYIPTHNCDPYDNDVAESMSLGSFLMLDTWTDSIVMEYTGRPDYADDFYEICRRACLFYNATLLYEQNKKGLFPYFSQKNCLHLLADTPEYLLDKQLIKGIGYGNTRKGVTTTMPIKEYGFGLIRDWLLKPVVKVTINEEGEEEETTFSNLYNIRNRALLKELILYHPQLNVDRIMALCMLMIYRQEKMVLLQGDLKRDEEKPSGMEADSYWDKNYPGKRSKWQ